ncbi:uncharacterized protein [Diadema antillarum]|uniref:uncharacterized protein n=1 Tax=Diadema antillarum TaxID=105358 RepID=UPI003A8BBA85
MSYFAIDPVDASVTLLQTVRHSEYDLFVMEVTASKGASVARATVIIDILEINSQRPTFLPVIAMYGYIYENSAVGTQVFADVAQTVPLVIQATDPDLEPDETPQLQYYTSDITNTFVLESIGEDRGYLVLSNGASLPLDAEERSNYTISDELLIGIACNQVANSNDTANLLNLCVVPPV